MIKYITQLGRMLLIKHMYCIVHGIHKVDSEGFGVTSSNTSVIVCLWTTSWIFMRPACQETGHNSPDIARRESKHEQRRSIERHLAKDFAVHPRRRNPVTSKDKNNRPTCSIRSQDSNHAEFQRTVCNSEGPQWDHLAFIWFTVVQYL